MRKGNRIFTSIPSITIYFISLQHGRRIYHKMEVTGKKGDIKLYPLKANAAARDVWLRVNGAYI